MQEQREGSFLLPIVNEKIYLGRRGKNPFQGYWGVIGGKAEHLKGDNPWNLPRYVTKLGGHKVMSICDDFLKKKGMEYLTGTVVREFCEEMFSGRKFPDDFNEEDFQNLVHLGYIDDSGTLNEKPFSAHNHFYIARIRRTDFSLKEGELTGFKPLEELTEGDEIFPLTKAVLGNLSERSPPQGFACGQISLRREWGILRRHKIDQLKLVCFPSFLPNIISNYLRIHSLADGSNVTAVAPKLSSPQFFLKFRMPLEQLNRRYTFYNSKKL